MNTLPITVSGFTVLPVTYQKSTHIIYARPHAVSKSAKSKNRNLPDGRTLFLVNVPPDASEREISLLFKSCGTVERVVFDHSPEEELRNEESDSDSEVAEEDVEIQDAEGQPEEQPRKKRKVSKEKQPKAPTVTPLSTTQLRTLRNTGGCAHVIFLDSSALDKAISGPIKPKSWPTSEEPRGLTHYMALHDSCRPPLDTVRAHADSAIELYDYEQAKNKQQAAYRKGEAVVDEDGFTLVTRGGAYGQTLGGGVGVANKKFQETGKMNNRKKKEGKEKESFYAFQKAEKQRKAIVDIKKNWEADKARIEKLKESRKYKPY
ncbi:hypothetical protein SERLA73DRAFT_187069 [Serpula lacrymans var. lacrymans S7.3]|uniref:RRM domain-containing protein n=2 Tax=Serpula lacrymans var. lacrymans TaxID=341189 RepID=F8Q8F8_SERL3|nr:uncharacterized protein SERLADRAFT_476432 [Serpula lacrymans var. lacrymans S7.9]EGN95846.1 hypothetical protein SERLA73DRAFT_187069 [Serpula lacrymans var. lacrymans S7.3]EGO21365.1 hypothetical protein SERLADRAFT_476432 [Serpula lacrymans var. lacrymans S7.9]